MIISMVARTTLVKIKICPFMIIIAMAMKINTNTIAKITTTNGNYDVNQITKRIKVRMKHVHIKHSSFLNVLFIISPS